MTPYRKIPNSTDLWILRRRSGLDAKAFWDADYTMMKMPKGITPYVRVIDAISLHVAVKYPSKNARAILGCLKEAMRKFHLGLVEEILPNSQNND